MRLIVGDCVEAMAAMPDASVDSVVCDPPYGLEFMGKKWDSLVSAPRGKTAGDSGGSKTIETRDDTPQHRAAVRQPSALQRCANCGGNSSGEWNRCSCGAPDFRSRSDLAYAMQEWHGLWAREALRVLKPGGYLLAFGGTRTYHRLTCAVEDAGFEIRDSILAWGYGSGFPKSLDVPKAIDKAAGVDVTDSERWRQEDHPGRGGSRVTPSVIIGQGDHRNESNPDGLRHVYESETNDAARWQGWGTALKPAFEPIVVARKPLSERSVAANVLKHGTGALNIDAARVAFADDDDESESKDKNRHGDFGSGPRENEVYGSDERARGDHGNYNAPGRWPANVLLVHHDDCVRVGTATVASDGHYPAARPGGVEIGTVGHAGQEGLTERNTAGETVDVWECVEGCPVRALDEQTGVMRARGNAVVTQRGRGSRNGWGMSDEPGPVDPGDAGGASRFFYQAKASRAEREAGLLGKVPCARCGELDTTEHEIEGRVGACIRNDHPTVKPIGVMRWLVKLVTRPGGVVLDPFGGSGTTGVACALEGFEFVGVEQEQSSAVIAWTRIEHFLEHGELALPVDKVERERAELDFEQLTL